MRKLPPEIYTPDEIQALLKACNGRGNTSVRNKALIVVLWRSMARIAEALALAPTDIDLESGMVTIQKGKRGKRRQVGIDRQSSQYIQAWLNLRMLIDLQDAPTLFCTLRGTKVQTSYIRAWLPRLGRKAGLSKRIHAHGLRHTGAMELQAEGVDLLLIRDQLGHSRATTTDAYLNHRQLDRLLETMRAREW